jgi:hypothetical protein
MGSWPQLRNGKRGIPLSACPIQRGILKKTKPLKKPDSGFSRGFDV